LLNAGAVTSGKLIPAMPEGPSGLNRPDPRRSDALWRWHHGDGNDDVGGGAANDIDFDRAARRRRRRRRLRDGKAGDRRHQY
jgi:hypothetical protein